MNRKKGLKEKRAAFVKKKVSKSNGSASDVVKRIANELFLSESTIWRDLQR